MKIICDQTNNHPSVIEQNKINIDIIFDDFCLICNRKVIGYEPKMCCSGMSGGVPGCGCMGLPTEPCICSDECYEALMSGIGHDYEYRRKTFNIPIRTNEPPIKI